MYSSLMQSQLKGCKWNYAWAYKCLNNAFIWFSSYYRSLFHMSIHTTREILFFMISPYNFVKWYVFVSIFMIIMNVLGSNTSRIRFPAIRYLTPSNCSTVPLSPNKNARAIISSRFALIFTVACLPYCRTPFWAPVIISASTVYVIAASF